MNNKENITWVEGEDFCRWKGVHYDEYKKIVGEDELHLDKPNICIIGNTAYVKLDQPISGDDLQGIKTVRDYSDLKNIDMEALREFTSDLDAYYQHPVVYKPIPKKDNLEPLITN